MEITTLTSKEFESFAKKNKYVTFHQKESWGKLKEKNGWKYSLLGMKNNNKVSNIISKIGQNTMGIYLTHMIFISIFYYLIPTERFIERLIFCVAVLCASFILTVCAQKQVLLKIMSIK